MSRISELQEKALLCAEAEAFVKSPLGREMIRRAQEVADAGLAGLRDVRPTDAAIISQLQNEVWRGESFQYWLADIIQEGLAAEKELAEPGE